MNSGQLRPSPAMVVALIALAVAASGTAIAANKIGTNQLKNNAVTKKKIKNKAVNKYKIAPKSINKWKIDNDAVNQYKIADGAVEEKAIADGAVSGAKIAGGAVDGPKVVDESLDDSKISDYEVLGSSFLQVNATNGISEAAARASAPEHSLYKKGPLEIYAKCFRDTVADIVYGEMYVRTTTSFSIMEGDDDLPGGPLATDYLNPGTAEVDRQLDSQSTGVNSASYNENEGLAGGADGTSLHLLSGIGVKNGAIFDNGPYGVGNACIFEGAAMG